MAKNRLSRGVGAAVPSWGLSLAAWAFVALLALFASPSAGGQRAADLPPPPGTLARELEGGSVPRRATEAPLGGPVAVLSRPIEIPFVLEGGQMIIEASIDGGPPLPFLFDTGAGRTMFTEETARSLEASTKRRMRVVGIGPKFSSGRAIEVDRIAIGAATFEHHTVIVLELRNVMVDRGSRARLGGVIGSELLTRYAVTIDFKKRVLTLNTPGYRPPSSQFALPLGMSFSPDGLGHPSVPAELDGVTGDFILDTGSSGEVFVSNAFQKSHALDSRGKTIRFLSVGGIGGPVLVRLGFGKRLRLGPLALSPPVIMNSVDETGFSAQAGVAGIIGNSVLGLFVVTIDYQAGRVYFDRIANRELPTAFHSSGMVLDKPEHEAFEVLDVLEGSAAQRAGLRRGDLVVEVAGRPARDLGLGDVFAASSDRSHNSIAVTTNDRRRFDLAIEKILP